MSDTLHLGSIITTPQARDATHIAVAPVASHERLSPGQHIGFLEDSTTHVSSTGALHGIVDPFLKDDVRPNQQFWMFLYPGTITGLRHEWSHKWFSKPVTSILDILSEEAKTKTKAVPVVPATVFNAKAIPSPTPISDSVLASQPERDYTPCCPDPEDEQYECCPEPEPDFQAEESEKWLREYVKEVCPYYASHIDSGYSAFMERVRDGEVFYSGSDLHDASELRDPDELFRHLSVVLGRPVNAASFEYSCSC